MSPSAKFRALVGSRQGELDDVMRAGTAPELDALSGSEFLGANTAAWTARLGMQQFIKGFERQADGRLLGYNRKVRQDGLDGEWAAPSERFAFFEVRPVEPASRHHRYPQALLLDYGAVTGPRLSLVRRLRDYLIQVEPSSNDLLLGRAFLALGLAHPSPTYFVLERQA